MSITLNDEYESGAPTDHHRAEIQVWAMDCIYGGCDHESDPDAVSPFASCPSSIVIGCQECSDQNAEYESGYEPWPCENQAVQAWQAVGGPERQYEAVVEAFLRGWREHERAVTKSTDLDHENKVGR